jgi:hypothetical protein
VEWLLTQLWARCHQTPHSLAFEQVSGVVAICMTSGFTCPRVVQPAARTHNVANRAFFIALLPPCV